MSEEKHALFYVSGANYGCKVLLESFPMEIFEILYSGRSEKDPVKTCVYEVLPDPMCEISLV